MARSNRERFVRPGWYEAYDRNNLRISTLVYVSNDEGYKAAARTFRIAPLFVGSQLDQASMDAENEEHLHIIAPDDWKRNKKKYGIGRRTPDSTEGKSQLGRTKRYKNWKKQDDLYRTNKSRPWNQSQYRQAISPMQRHMYPYQGNIRYDMGTQSQFTIPQDSRRRGMMPNW